MSAPRKRKKGPVVHCVIVKSQFGSLRLHVLGGETFSRAALDAGFREGDRVSIVMRRSGPKREKRKGRRRGGASKRASKRREVPGKDRGAEGLFR